MSTETPTLEDDAASWIVAIGTWRDRTSFIALFTQFAPKVKGYLIRQGVSEPVAEELAQETLLAIWRRAHQFDPARASAAAWIYTIARNLWVDLLRHERHPSDGRIAEQPDAQRTPEEDLKAAESHTRLRVAIDALSPEQAEVLSLFYFEDQTHPQIADRLRLPLGTVKSRIRLASTHLRAALDGMI